MANIISLKYLNSKLHLPKPELINQSCRRLLVCLKLSIESSRLVGVEQKLCEEHTHTRTNPFTCSLKGNVTHIFIILSELSYHHRTGRSRTSFLIMQCHFRIRKYIMCKEYDPVFLILRTEVGTTLNAEVISTTAAISYLCEVIPQCFGKGSFFKSVYFPSGWL